jgi:hypothetical protein
MRVNFYIKLDGILATTFTIALNKQQKTITAINVNKSHLSIVNVFLRLVITVKSLD